MSHGVVEDWEDMETVWKSVYSELKIHNPQEHNVLITESALNPYSNRAKISEIFFESFGVPAIYFENQAVLSLYAQGKTTGVVVDVGDGVTQVAPIVDGFCVKKAVRRQDLGGRDVTAYLMQLLQRSGLTGFHTSAEFQIC
jgi:actin-related protein